MNEVESRWFQTRLNRVAIKYFDQPTARVQVCIHSSVILAGDSRSTGWKHTSKYDTDRESVPNKTRGDLRYSEHDFLRTVPPQAGSMLIQCILSYILMYMVMTSSSI